MSVRTVAFVRVELRVRVDLDGSYAWGPGLDDRVLPDVVGAELVKDGRPLATVEVGDARVVGYREEDVPDEFYRDPYVPWEDGE